MSSSSPTPTQFAASHGDPSTWSATDFEVHQHLAEVARLEAELLVRHSVVDAPSSVPLAAA